MIEQPQGYFCMFVALFWTIITSRPIYCQPVGGRPSHRLFRMKHTSNRACNYLKTLCTLSTVLSSKQYNAAWECSLICAKLTELVEERVRLTMSSRDAHLHPHWWLRWFSVYVIWLIVGWWLKSITAVMFLKCWIGRPSSYLTLNFGYCVCKGMIPSRTWNQKA